MRRRRSAVLLGALLLDVLLGDIESRWHPVAVMGRTLGLAYRPWPRGSARGQLVPGAAALLVPAAVWTALALAVERSARRHGRLDWVILALALKPSFAVRQLLAEAHGVASFLEAGELAAARHRLRALVSRPSANLPADLVASAAIESVAENLADSIVAPVLYFRLFGLPGAVVYRVVNTADAMFGYHGEFEWLGKAAARADDVLSWLPSRLAALGIVGSAALLEGREAGRRALALAVRDGRLTESPNAGWPMAAMAGALGRRLEKPGHYVLGSGLASPTAADVRRATTIAALTAALAFAAPVLVGARR